MASRRREHTTDDDPWRVSAFISALMELLLSVLLLLGAAIAFITSQLVKYFGLDPPCTYIGCSHPLVPCSSKRRRYSVRRRHHPKVDHLSHLFPDCRNSWVYSKLHIQSEEFLSSNDDTDGSLHSEKNDSSSRHSAAVSNDLDVWHRHLDEDRNVSYDNQNVNCACSASSSPIHRKPNLPKNVKPKVSFIYDDGKQSAKEACCHLFYVSACSSNFDANEDCELSSLSSDDFKKPNSQKEQLQKETLTGGDASIWRDNKPEHQYMLPEDEELMKPNAAIFGGDGTQSGREELVPLHSTRSVSAPCSDSDTEDDSQMSSSSTNDFRKSSSQKKKLQKGTHLDADTSISGESEHNHMVLEDEEPSRRTYVKPNSAIFVSDFMQSAKEERVPLFFRSSVSAYGSDSDNEHDHEMSSISTDDVKKPSKEKLERQTLVEGNALISGETEHECPYVLLEDEEYSRRKYVKRNSAFFVGDDTQSSKEECVPRFFRRSVSAHGSDSEAEDDCELSFTSTDAFKKPSFEKEKLKGGTLVEGKPSISGETEHERHYMLLEDEEKFEGGTLVEGKASISGETEYEHHYMLLEDEEPSRREYVKPNFAIFVGDVTQSAKEERVPLFYRRSVSAHGSDFEAEGDCEMCSTSTDDFKRPSFEKEKLEGGGSASISGETEHERHYMLFEDEEPSRRKHVELNSAKFVGDVMQSVKEECVPLFFRSSVSAHGSDSEVEDDYEMSSTSTDDFKKPSCEKEKLEGGTLVEGNASISGETKHERHYMLLEDEEPSRQKYVKPNAAIFVGDVTQSAKEECVSLFFRRSVSAHRSDSDAEDDCAMSSTSTDDFKKPSFEKEKLEGGNLVEAHASISRDTEHERHYMLLKDEDEEVFEAPFFDSIESFCNCAAYQTDQESAKFEQGELVSYEGCQGNTAINGSFTEGLKLNQSFDIREAERGIQKHEVSSEQVILQSQVVKAEQDKEETSLGEDQEEGLDALREALRAERIILAALETELENERNAAAIATSEAMAMISRLQEEKSAMQMEVVQLRRMSEEKADYDEQAIELLKEILLKREKEKHALEKEVELYRERLFAEKVKKSSAEKSNKDVSIPSLTPVLLLRGSYEDHESLSSEGKNDRLKALPSLEAFYDAGITSSPHITSMGQNMACRERFGSSPQPVELKETKGSRVDQVGTCFQEDKGNLAESFIKGLNVYHDIHQELKGTSRSIFSTNGEETQFILEHLWVLEEELQVLRGEDGLGASLEAQHGDGSPAKRKNDRSWADLSGFRCVDGEIEEHKDEDGAGIFLPIHDVYEVQSTSNHRGQDVQQSDRLESSENTLKDFESFPRVISQEYMATSRHSHRPQNISHARTLFPSKETHCDSALAFDQDYPCADDSHKQCHEATDGRLVTTDVIQQLAVRLQVLETDRELLREIIESFGHRDTALKLLQEIAQHLRELQMVGSGGASAGCVLQGPFLPPVGESCGSALKKRRFCSEPGQTQTLLLQQKSI